MSKIKKISILLSSINTKLPLKRKKASMVFQFYLVLLIPELHGIIKDDEFIFQFYLVLLIHIYEYPGGFLEIRFQFYLVLLIRFTE